MCTDSPSAEPADPLAPLREVDRRTRRLTLVRRSGPHSCSPLSACSRRREGTAPETEAPASGSAAASQ
ncbi:hypothetical protein ABKW33_12325 [Sanguibacter sp. 26GB23]